VHFYGIARGLHRAVYIVSIPCRVFCAFLRRVYTRLLSRVYTRFNPLQGFLCISTQQWATLLDPEFLFQSLAGFSVHFYKGAQTRTTYYVSRFNPLQGFLCISTSPQTGGSAPPPTFQSLAGFSVHFYCREQEIKEKGSTMFQSLAGFSVHFYQGYRSDRCRHRPVSIPCRVFCAFLLCRWAGTSFMWATFQSLAGFSVHFY